MDAKLARQLKINLGAYKRLFKEKEMYAKELEEAKENIEKSEAEHDSFEYKNLLNLREESEAMIVDSEKRLEAFKTKLLATLKEAEAFPEDPMVIEAKAFFE